jgi:TP901 family phage tail tape measure protein
MATGAGSGLRASREVAIYMKAVDKMGPGLKSSESSLKGFVDSAASMAKRLTIAFGAALTAVTAFAVYIGTEFEQAMANTSSMFVSSAKNAEQMNTWMRGLEQTARALGASTAFTATEAGNAMYSLASGGLTAKEVMEATEQVLYLAGATMTGMTEAAELLMSSLRQFGLEATESARVANVFAAAIQNSMLNMERLHFAMQYTGPVAARLGLTIEETAAALAILHNAGLKGSLAGTGMRQVMVRLTRPTEELRRKLEGVSVSVDGFGAVLDKLRERGMRPDEVARMFGQRTLAAITSLLAAGADGFERMTATITDTRAASMAYERQMNTVRSQFIILKSVAQEAGITIFKTMRDDLMAGLKLAQRAVQGATPAIKTFYTTTRDAIRESIPHLKVFFESFVRGILYSWEVIKWAGLQIIEWFKSFGGLGKLFYDVADAVIFLVGNAATLAYTFGALAALFGLLTGNYGLIALSGLFVGLAIDMRKAKQEGKSLNDYFSELVDGADLAAVVLGTLGTAMGEIVWKFATAIPAFLLSVAQSFGSFFRMIINQVSDWGTALLKALNPFDNFNLQDYFDSYEGILVGNWNNMVKEMADSWTSNFTVGNEWFEGAFDALDDRAREIFIRIAKRAHGLGDDAAGALRSALEGVEGWTLDIPDFKDFKIPKPTFDIESPFAGLSDFLKPELDFMGAAWDGFMDYVESEYFRLWDTLWDTTMTGSEKWKELWDRAFSAVGDMLLRAAWDNIVGEQLKVKWAAWAGAEKAKMKAAEVNYEMLMNEAVHRHYVGLLGEKKIAEENYFMYKHMQHQKNLADAGEETAANTQTAASGFFRAYAWLPWVGFGLAVAAIIGMIAQLGKMHTGGMVGQLGSNRETTRVLQEGEYVMPVAQTRQFYPILEQMRNGETPAFSAAGVGGGSAPSAINVNVNVGAGSLLLANDEMAVRRLSEVIADDIDKRVSRRRSP